MSLVFGIHPVLTALEAGEIERIVVVKPARNPRLQRIIDLARERAVDLRFEPRVRLDQLAGGSGHQGVVGYVAGRPLLQLEDLVARAGPAPLFLLLDGIEDPHNLGAILRSADGAGVSGVVLPKRRSAPLSETVWKVSAGAAQHVPIARVANLHQTIRALQEMGTWVVGADLSAGRQWYEADLTGPIALVLGREGEGLHRLVRENCDELIRLPMRGRVQSLNVGVTAGILLYEAVRQRQTSGVKRNGDVAPTSNREGDNPADPSPPAR
ncbi:MAG: 23S rRNA (guanosine(2251)-2'-O)-methyltransferase RlmB [Acidobacteria bacterium]|nr:23S rRNA (guanosine(2251)-2'-O)-methyltransferase RlmB [Acidobacteriota bacterium]